MTNLNDYVESIKFFHSLYHSQTSVSAKKQTKTLISYFWNTLEPINGILVSEKAAELAMNEWGLSVDFLKSMHWGQQTKYDAGRKLLHWEHMMTRKNLTELTIEGVDPIELLSKHQICWITKEEDATLNKIAKSDRPNPYSVYESANINLI